MNSYETTDGRTPPAYTTDNRWSPGASGATVPESAPAAYSARWIDQGDTTPADVLPDRQGFAYNSTMDRDALIDALNDTPHIRIPNEVRDETEVVALYGWTIARRRAGGYVYVDAWLTPLPELTWRVVCFDGKVRHNGTFATLFQARVWADSGHACARNHTFVEVWS